MKIRKDSFTHYGIIYHRYEQAIPHALNDLEPEKQTDFWRAYEWNKGRFISLLKITASKTKPTPSFSCKIECNGETKPIHAHVSFNFYFDHFDTLFFILD